MNNDTFMTTAQFLKTTSVLREIEVVLSNNFYFGSFQKILLQKL